MPPRRYTRCCPSTPRGYPRHSRWPRCTFPSPYKRCRRRTATEVRPGTRSPDRRSRRRCRRRRLRTPAACRPGTRSPDRRSRRRCRRCRHRSSAQRSAAGTRRSSDHTAPRRCRRCRRCRRPACRAGNPSWPRRSRPRCTHSRRRTVGAHPQRRRRPDRSPRRCTRRRRGTGCRSAPSGSDTPAPDRTDPACRYSRPRS